MKITSRSRLVLAIVFAVSGFMCLIGGKALMSAVWFTCTAIHFFDAYRLHCQEKEQI
ncbi:MULTISPECIES: hypothetical protein [unclassified Butyrivibrio]|uniref:hypothetical protein n=1 Tax=unclassified Butyrivibrio TaxID=2639466 RepID=UPI000410043D|nr:MULTISPECIES: hypothetical protein [unclassified Butyrivibrio]